MRNILRSRRSLKGRFRSCARIFAGWTSLAHPAVTEIFCKSGVAFVGIDLEHSTISLDLARQSILVCHAAGVMCLPRIASHNAEMSRRLLDAGADGLIVPTVSTPKEVEQIVSWSKYPPAGCRGYGVSRAQGFGFDFSDYVKTWNETSSLLIQIETVQGVENVEKIIASDWVDGVMVGPYDLSGSLGIPGQIDHPRVRRACRHVVAACAKAGKSCGTHLVEADAPSVRRAFSSGFNFVILSSDIFLLWKWGARMRTLMRALSRSRL